MEDTQNETTIPLVSSDDCNLRVETVEGIDNNDEGVGGSHGNVAIRNVTTPDHSQHQQFDSGNALHSDADSASSSWASKDDIRRSAVIKQKREQRSQRGKRWSSIKKKRNKKGTPSKPSGIRRTQTPTTNNLSAASGGFFSEHDNSIDGEDLTASLLSPTLIMDGGVGTGKISTRYQNHEQQQQNFHNQEQPQQQPSSYRKWLAEGMLETLNVMAGITLSTTGTILSPPIAMTKNIIIPSLLAILVDTLDAVTPHRVQGWFRILSSSMYHLFAVLVTRSTEKGEKFREKVTLVFKSFLEAWGAPESRQVVVDGMSTGVKFMDAMHTPEMKVFLDQLGVLSCRLVDAMASGKSKEFLLNSKDLIWSSIELACDPSTTLALAEVTAHLCHALKEIDDSYDDATPRAVRNAHNEKAYLNSSTMTKDYPFQSMEEIILSSLGMDGDHYVKMDNNFNESVDIPSDSDDGMDHDSTEQSIPSNVAFQVELGSESNPLEIPNINQTQETKKSSFENCKERVDTDLLKRKILCEGRPKARLQKSNFKDENSSKISLKDKLSTSKSPATKSFNANNVGDMEGEYANIEADMEELPLPRESQNPPIKLESRNPGNVRELYEKFERMETNVSESPPHIQFADALNKLLSEKGMGKGRKMSDMKAAREQDGKDDIAYLQADCREIKSKIRKVMNGSAREEMSGSKTARQIYSNFRQRLWKYPPSLLRINAVILLSIFVLWIGFGTYGMYTFFNHVVFRSRGTSMPSMNRKFLQHGEEHHQRPLKHVFEESSNTHRSNEIVIRIVKEVVHIREDGSKIENFAITTDKSNREKGKSEDFAMNNFFEEDINRIQDCVVSSLEEVEGSGNGDL